MSKNVIIISDAHSDKDAMRRIREAERYFPAEGIISAGDLSPDPSDPLFYSIDGVRGNCDRFYEYGSLYFPPLEKTMTIWGKKVYITHSHLPFDIPDDTDVVITGHTHIPRLERKGGRVYLNPGSISQPRSSVGPTFALFSPTSISLLSLLDFSLIKSLSFSSS